jgi:hypothetical protein
MPQYSDTTTQTYVPFPKVIFGQYQEVARLNGFATVQDYFAQNIVLEERRAKNLAELKAELQKGFDSGSKFMGEKEWKELGDKLGVKNYYHDEV